MVDYTSSFYLSQMFFCSRKAGHIHLQISVLVPESGIPGFPNFCEALEKFAADWADSGNIRLNKFDAIFTRHFHIFDSSISLVSSLFFLIFIATGIAIFIHKKN
jgi:hypothetical protein